MLPAATQSKDQSVTLHSSTWCHGCSLHYKLHYITELSEVEDIKKTLDFLSEEVSAVRLQQKGILMLVEEVKALRIQNEENDRKIVFLENRVADLEQYTRMNNIIITGLDIKSRSYARAVATTNGEESEDLDVRSTEQQVAPQ